MDRNLALKLYSIISFCLILLTFQLLFLSISNATQSNTISNTDNNDNAKEQNSDEKGQKNTNENNSNPPAKEKSSGLENEKESKSKYYSSLISAFVAAILTFLATQYTENRNWKRRKSEYLRDKQFSKIVESARMLNNTTKVCNEIYNRVVVFEEKCKTEPTSNSIRYIELNSFIKTNVEALKKGELDFDANMLELKLLKVIDGKILEIQYVRKTVLELINILEESIDKKEQFSSKRLIHSINKVNQDTSIFVENALHAISG